MTTAEREREKNPMKLIAMDLTHQMDDEERLREKILPTWEEEEIRAYGDHLRNEIFKRGYDIQTILHYVEEYKNLTFTEYREWLYV